MPREHIRAENRLPEQAFLFAAAAPGEAGRTTVERALAELEALAEAASAEVVGSTYQVRQKPDAAYYLGRGKLAEIKMAAESLGADLLICDDELSGSQLRNIERETGIRTIDRTNLILAVFAARATGSEGRLQVELAQYRYRLPRLKSTAGELSRQGGGIGTRGPGETRLETDRRHIRERIRSLEKRLQKVEAHQARLRAARRRRGDLTVAVTGYTNAGKSTLINALCKADLYAEDRLFATLSAAGRELYLPLLTSRGRRVLLVDTIGFVSKLPHHLVAAFRSTLAEAATADFVLKLVDGADPEAAAKLQVTTKLLQEIGAGDLPEMTVINKKDKIRADADLSALYGNIAGPAKLVPQISAVTGAGLPELKDSLQSELLKI